VRTAMSMRFPIGVSPLKRWDALKGVPYSR